MFSMTFLFNRFAHSAGQFLVSSDSYVSGWLLGDWLLADKLLGSKCSIFKFPVLRAVELMLGVRDAYWSARDKPDRVQEIPRGVLGGLRGHRGVSGACREGLWTL